MNNLANSVRLVGCLGKDPAVRYSDNGTAITNFSLAVNDGYGEKRKTTWVPVRALGKLAEVIANNLSKGRKILVGGKLREGATREGKKYLYVLADSIQFLDKPKTSQEVS